MNFKEYFLTLCVASFVQSAPSRNSTTVARQNFTVVDMNNKHNFGSPYPDLSELELDEEATNEFISSFKPRIPQKATNTENSIGNAKNNTNTTVSENKLQNEVNENNRSVPKDTVDSESKSNLDFRRTPEDNKLETYNNSVPQGTPKIGNDSLVSAEGNVSRSIENVTEPYDTDYTESTTYQPYNIKQEIGTKLGSSLAPDHRTIEAENSKLAEKNKLRNERIQRCILRKQQEYGYGQPTLNKGADTYEDSYEYVDD